MTCEEYINLMTEYMEGELKPDMRELWEKHFDGCPGCGRFFQGFQNSIELVDYLRNESCPPEVSRRLQMILWEKTRAAGSQGS